MAPQVRLQKVPSPIGSCTPYDTMVWMRPHLGRCLRWVRRFEQQLQRGRLPVLGRQLEGRPAVLHQQNGTDSLNGSRPGSVEQSVRGPCRRQVETAFLLAESKSSSQSCFVSASTPRNTPYVKFSHLISSSRTAIVDCSQDQVLDLKFCSLNLASVFAETSVPRLPKRLVMDDSPPLEYARASVIEED